MRPTAYVGRIGNPTYAYVPFTPRNPKESINIVVGQSIAVDP